MWGCDTAADSDLRTLLSEMRLLQLPKGLAAASSRGQDAAAQPVDCGCLCMQPADISRGAATVSLPTNRHSVAEQPQEALKAAFATPTSQHWHAAPGLLRHSPAIVAERLLVLVALTKRLAALLQSSEFAVRYLAGSCSSMCV